MIPWIGLLGLLIGVISPVASVLYVMLYSGKNLCKENKANLNFLIVWICTSLFIWLLGIINYIQLVNLVFGAGLSVFLVFELLKKDFDFKIISMVILFYNSLFMFIRQLVFADKIFYDYEQSVDEALKILSIRFEENPEQFQLFMDMIEITKDFYLKYSPGIWLGSLILCLMVGLYYFSKKYLKKNILATYQVSIYVIYTFIVALIFAILTESRILAVNYLIALLPLFLFQGLAVVQTKIGHWFIQSKILYVIAVLSLVLNPYLVIFISVIGLFDNWFDFRNLSQLEESHENNSN